MACLTVAGVLVAATAIAVPIVLPKDMDGPCVKARTFPAYSHNDEERNGIPASALFRGFIGVEVDLQFVRGRLLVGHDRETTRPNFTFENSYLRGLEARRKRCGAILSGGKPFWLFIDMKTKGMPAYRALRTALASSDSLFTTVREGEERPGPVTVVLVGWCPPLDTLRAEETRYVSVHRLLEEVTPEDVAAPAHLVRMVSLDAKRLKGWSGKGRAPSKWDAAFERLRAARGTSGGRIARLFHSRVNAGIYAYALANGADLIGTEFLEESRTSLTAIGAYRNSASP